MLGIAQYNLSVDGSSVRNAFLACCLDSLSVFSKVSRDRYMEKLHEEFPMYNWRKNAGYLTAEHLKAIDEFGITKYFNI